MSRAAWSELGALDARVLRATDPWYERSPERVGELAGCAADVALSTLRRLRTSRGRGAGARAVSEALRQAIGARSAVRTGELAPAVRAPARRPRCVSGEICRIRQPDYAALIPGLAVPQRHAGSHAALTVGSCSSFPNGPV
jgi:hypothetical protein